MLLGHSTCDARRFFNDMFGQGTLSHALVFRLLRRFDSEIASWKYRRITKDIAVLVLDAVHLKGAITGSKRVKLVVLCAYCGYTDGTEELVDLEPVKYESSESYSRLCASFTACST